HGACVEQDDKGWDARKRAYCLKIQPATGSFARNLIYSTKPIMPKPDGLTAVKNLAEAFEHYNEWHPHSALGYRSPREYLRRRTSNGLSDKKCMEI
ncbi:integrase core domain-containing protein, partial [Escherichia coli]